MFKEVTKDQLEIFRLIYHQTTGFTNPIIESVLYQNKNGCGIYYWGRLTDGNYMVFHRSGCAHINFNTFDESLDLSLMKKLDDFIMYNSQIPDNLMFFYTPEKLINYWKTTEKRYFKVRRRRRYQIDYNQFMKLDPLLYKVPLNLEIRPIQKCTPEDLLSLDKNLFSTFYSSAEDFFQNCFGFVLFSETGKPMSIGYLLCYVGRDSECGLLTLPEFRNKGYGFITITNYVRESIIRKVNVGWDCYMTNHTNEWVKMYGYTHIIREYDCVTFLK